MKTKKPKAVPVKKAVKSLRPSISDSSLNFLPDDALEGFQERIEYGVEWNLHEQAARHHRINCKRDEIPAVKFSEALQDTIKKSILYGFLEDHNVSLQVRWDSLLTMDLWNKDNIDKEEKDPCLKAEDLITDDVLKLIKKAVLLDDRNVLKEELKKVSVLRVIDAKMTILDEELRRFKNLSILNLGANIISDFNSEVLPRNLKMLELQSNAMRKIDGLAKNAPESLTYLGLSGNLLTDETSLEAISKLLNITVLDLSDNDICDLNTVLSSLVELPKLTSLQLIGNPCAVCAAYAKTAMKRLPRLKWLDNHEIMDSDRPSATFEPHSNDLRSSYFNFAVYRIFSVPEPPKLDKGSFQSFHVELELPLLDSTRRKFLMYHQNEELTKILPPTEDDQYTKEASSSQVFNLFIDMSTSKSTIYHNLERRNSREIRHYTVFESNKVQWNKIMSFQEPTVRILCPNLFALRDTFRSVITVRLVYTLATSKKDKSVSRLSKSSSVMLRHMNEHRVTLATVRCSLRQPRWWETTQHFCWDSSLDDEAVSCSDEIKQQYNIGKPKPQGIASKHFLPEHLTCFFGFDIDTV
ncbi:uncharacterized protein LOC121727544 [Aricia agestis]|uniref:uncharacterized protein LOC121727544 n=1 Tax=Aricia agestis TaxID=91739 RepID=UPI001C2074D6|nr:uncharacterized protein LOC121727544 [Aricia agestis]